MASGSSLCRRPFLLEHSFISRADCPNPAGLPPPVCPPPLPPILLPSAPACSGLWSASAVRLASGRSAPAWLASLCPLWPHRPASGQPLPHAPARLAVAPACPCSSGWPLTLLWLASDGAMGPKVASPSPIAAAAKLSHFRPISVVHCTLPHNCKTIDQPINKGRSITTDQPAFMSQPSRTSTSLTAIPFPAVQLVCPKASFPILCPL